MATTIATEKPTWAVRMIRLRRASASGWSMGVAVIRTHPSSGLAARQNAALYSACCSRWVAADVDSSAGRFMALRTGQPDPTTLLTGRWVVKAAEYAPGPPATRRRRVHHCLIGGGLRRAAAVRPASVVPASHLVETWVADDEEIARAGLGLTADEGPQALRAMTSRYSLPMTTRSRSALGREPQRCPVRGQDPY